MARAYSNSKIGTFENCPRQYKFQHIERAAVEKPVSVEAFLGDTVHRSLEKLYLNKTSGRVMTREELLKLYAGFWEGPGIEKIKVARENMSVEDYIRVGREGLKKYYELFTPFDDSDIIALEKKISFPLDEAGRFTINGKIDRIGRRPDGTLEIVDYKTGAFPPTQRALESDRQMGLYQLGVKYLWPDFEKIELKQIFLRQGMVMTAEMNDERLEEIKYGAIQKILEIENAAREDDFPPKESALCDWCVYFSLCPAKRHGLALEEEIDDDFAAVDGRELAEQYLKKNEEKRKLESELKALKEDIILFCRRADLTTLEGESGALKLSLTERDAFPGKTENEDDFLAISLLARQAGLEECFRLETATLYKEFYARERLEPELKEKLKKYLIRRRQEIIRTRYKNR